MLAIALIFLMQLPSFSTLADKSGCPVHGPGCAHGSECPAVLTQTADESSAECPSGGHGKNHAKMKKYRCALTSCHGEALAGSGLDAPVVVEGGFELFFVERVAIFEHQNTQTQDPFSGEALEPPEAFSVS